MEINVYLSLMLKIVLNIKSTKMIDVLNVKTISFFMRTHHYNNFVLSLFTSVMITDSFLLMMIVLFVVTVLMVITQTLMKDVSKELLIIVGNMSKFLSKMYVRNISTIFLF